MKHLLLTIALAACANAHATLTLHVSSTTHFEALPGATAARPERHEEEEVRLGEHYIAVASGSTTNVFDFTQRKRYAIDTAKGSYVAYSLFDTVGFRVMELANRQNLARMMAAAKIDGAPFDQVFAEQSMSLQASAAGWLDEAADGGDTLASIDGKLLARRSNAGREVSAPDAANFVQYLRYTAGGHPLVLARLASARRIPERLVLHFREGGQAITRSYQFSVSADSAAPSYDLKPYHARQAEAAPDDLDQILDRAASAPPTGLASARDKLKNEMAKAWGDARALDVTLGLMEFALQTGEAPAPLSDGQKALLQGDPAVKQFYAVIGADSKEKLQQALPVLQSLRPRSQGKQYMLALFEANDRVRLGETKSAGPLYATVLNANPWLAGAYKDLGDYAMINFDTPRAWRSWDAGRRIAPKLYLFDAVNQFEARLAKDHPEYF